MSRRSQRLEFEQPEAVRMRGTSTAAVGGVAALHRGVDDGMII